MKLQMKRPVRRPKAEQRDVLIISHRLLPSAMLCIVSDQSLRCKTMRGDSVVISGVAFHGCHCRVTRHSVISLLSILISSLQRQLSSFSTSLRLLRIEQSERVVGREGERRREREREAGRDSERGRERERQRGTVRKGGRKQEREVREGKR